MSMLSKTFCDSSVVKLRFKYPPPTLPRPPNFYLCQNEIPSILQTEGGGDGGEAVSSGSTWLWSSLDQGPGLDVNIECSSPRSAHDTVTGQADRGCLHCISAWLWMSFKNRQVQESGEEGERVLFVFMLTGQRQVPLSLVSALIFTPFPLLVPTPLCIHLFLFFLYPLHAERRSYSHPTYYKQYIYTPCRNEAASNPLCPPI